ncbi:hypothetical protein ACFW4O_36165 [Streptomyces mutabilis]|uniref:hypothetical protein n=1 Tax=Streptomyces mutabilis TaxID=67332 RepID=UPI0036C210D2
MGLDPLAAAITGVLAAQVMEVPAYLQRAAGAAVHQNIFAEAGAILRIPPPYQRLAGWAGHALLAVAIMFMYTMSFATVADNDHLLWWGLLAGAIHGALGGVVVGAWPDLHPQIPGHLEEPGVFYRHYGHRDVVTFWGGHLLFGLVSGTCYPALHRGLPFGAAL